MSDLIKSLEADIKRLTKELGVQETRHHEQLADKDAVIGRLRSRATYFIAQFENDWDLGRISIESKRAMDELDAELDSQ